MQLGTLRPASPAGLFFMSNKSTGPRSAEGKARSSMNALKTGIYSKSLVIPGEHRADLDTLTDEYYSLYQPADPLQRDLVDTLVRCTWSLRRYTVAETQIFIYEIDSAIRPSEETPIGKAFVTGSSTLSRLQRIINSTQRNHRDALRELERLQALHPAAADPIPVPEPTPQPIETPPVTPDSEAGGAGDSPGDSPALRSHDETNSPASAAPPKSPRKPPKKPVTQPEPTAESANPPVEPPAAPQSTLPEEPLR